MHRVWKLVSSWNRYVAIGAVDIHRSRIAICIYHLNYFKHFFYFWLVSLEFKFQCPKKEWTQIIHNMIRNFVPILKNQNYQSEKVTYIYVQIMRTQICFLKNLHWKHFCTTTVKYFVFITSFLLPNITFPYLLTYLQDQWPGRSRNLFAGAWAGWKTPAPGCCCVT